MKLFKATWGFITFFLIVMIVSGCGTANEVESVQQVVKENIMRKYDDATNIAFSSTDVSRIRETVSSLSGQYAETSGTFETESGKKRFSYVLEKFGEDWDIQVFKSNIKDY